MLSSVVNYSNCVISRDVEGKQLSFPAYSQLILSTKRVVCKTQSCFKRDKENFRKVVSEALNVQSWRVADMEFEQMKTDKDCVTYKFLLIGKLLW